MPPCLSFLESIPEQGWLWHTLRSSDILLDLVDNWSVLGGEGKQYFGLMLECRDESRHAREEAFGTILAAVFYMVPGMKKVLVSSVGETRHHHSIAFLCTLACPFHSNCCGCVLSDGTAWESQWEQKPGQYMCYKILVALSAHLW